MSQKRILIVTGELVPFHYGGIGTQFKSLAAFLNRRGHHAYFLARKPENYDEELYRSHYGETPLFFVDAPPARLGVSPHFVYAAEVARRFDEVYPVINPDVVILADFNAEGLFLLLRSGTGAYQNTAFLLTINGMNREIISVHQGDGRGVSDAIADRPDIRSLLAMEDLCVHLAPMIVSPTVGAWEDVRRRLGIQKPATIIPNLVDFDLFRPDAGVLKDTRGLPDSGKDFLPEMNHAEDDLRGESGKPLILFVGRLDRMKGADLLLKAYMEIAAETDRDIPRIVFVGRDCFWSEYGSTFLEHWKKRIPERYADTISFAGQIGHERVRDYLKEAAVAVFPSRWEPFGIVCLEAMAMGCPVVVSNGTGLEEVIGAEFAEFAVSVTEDIQPLARKITEFLQADPRAFSERWQRRAREVVRQAENGWLDLLESIGREMPVLHSEIKPLYDSLHRLLASVEESCRGTVHIQVYFRRLGGYSESDSLRMSYSRLHWTAIKFGLPRGTGESPIRLDPTDVPGMIRIREIVLLDESGSEIWRADDTNRFEGCAVVGKDSWRIEKGCFVIAAESDDTQMLLDCPATDRPVELHVAICSGDDVKAELPFSGSRI